MRPVILTGIVVAVGVAAYVYMSNPQSTQMPGANAGGRPGAVNVVVPELTGNAVIGERIFNAKCAACHGENAAGRDGAGPPLINKIYEPSHHGDAAFLVAARNGVRAHHWPFGNMPPVKGVSDAEVSMVVDYIRTLQRENGIN